jgi:hypothetical protein
MVRMTFDRKVTLISVGFAVVASLAGTFQGYISWRGRNDALKSAVLAEIAKDCHDIALDAGKSVEATDQAKYASEMSAKASAVDLLIDAIQSNVGPTVTVYSEVSKYLDEKFDQVAAKDGLAPAKAEDKTSSPEIRFMVNLADTCRKVIKEQI